NPDQLETFHRSPISLVQQVPDLRSGIRDVYAEAFAKMIRVVTAVSGAAVFTSLFTLERNPPPINRGLNCDKDDSSSRNPSEIELDDVASDRSVLGFVEPTMPAPTLQGPAPSIPAVT